MHLTKEMREAVEALRSNSYHDFEREDAEAIVRSLYKRGFRIVRSGTVDKPRSS